MDPRKYSENKKEEAGALREVMRQVEPKSGEQSTERADKAELSGSSVQEPTVLATVSRGSGKVLPPTTTSSVLDTPRQNLQLCFIRPNQFGHTLVASTAASGSRPLGQMPPRSYTPPRRSGQFPCAESSFSDPRPLGQMLPRCPAPSGLSGQIPPPDFPVLGFAQFSHMSPTHPGQFPPPFFPIAGSDQLGQMPPRCYLLPRQPGQIPPRHFPIADLSGRIPPWPSQVSDWSGHPMPPILTQVSDPSEQLTRTPSAVSGHSNQIPAVCFPAPNNPFQITRMPPPPNATSAHSDEMFFLSSSPGQSCQRPLRFIGSGWHEPAQSQNNAGADVPVPIFSVPSSTPGFPVMDKSGQLLPSGAVASGWCNQMQPQRYTIGPEPGQMSLPWSETSDGSLQRPPQTSATIGLLDLFRPQCALISDPSCNMNLPSTNHSGRFNHILEPSGVSSLPQSSGQMSLSIRNPNLSTIERTGINAPGFGISQILSPNTSEQDLHQFLCPPPPLNILLPSTFPSPLMPKECFPSNSTPNQSDERDQSPESASSSPNQSNIRRSPTAITISPTSRNRLEPSTMLAKSSKKQRDVLDQQNRIAPFSKNEIGGREQSTTVVSSSTNNNEKLKQSTPTSSSHLEVSISTASSSTRQHHERKKSAAIAKSSAKVTRKQHIAAISSSSNQNETRDQPIMTACNHHSKLESPRSVSTSSTNWRGKQEQSAAIVISSTNQSVWREPPATVGSSSAPNNRTRGHPTPSRSETSASTVLSTNHNATSEPPTEIVSSSIKESKELDRSSPPTISISYLGGQEPAVVSAGLSISSSKDLPLASQSYRSSSSIDTSILSSPNNINLSTGTGTAFLYPCPSAMNQNQLPIITPCLNILPYTTSRAVVSDEAKRADGRNPLKVKETGRQKMQTRQSRKTPNSDARFTQPVATITASIAPSAAEKRKIAPKPSCTDQSSNTTSVSQSAPYVPLGPMENPVRFVCFKKSSDGIRSVRKAKISEDNRIMPIRRSVGASKSLKRPKKASTSNSSSSATKQPNFGKNIVFSTVQISEGNNTTECTNEDSDAMTQSSLSSQNKAGKFKRPKKSTQPKTGKIGTASGNIDPSNPSSNSTGYPSGSSGNNAASTSSLSSSTSTATSNKPSTRSKKSQKGSSSSSNSTQEPGPSSRFHGADLGSGFDNSIKLPNSSDPQSSIGSDDLELEFLRDRIDANPVSSLSSEDSDPFIFQNLGTETTLQKTVGFKTAARTKIESSVLDVVNQIVVGDCPILIEQRRPSPNMASNFCNFGEVRLSNKRSRKKFCGVMHLMSKLYKMSLEERLSTKRDIFYEDVPLYGRQQTFESYLKSLCSMLQVPRAALGVCAASKGLMAGHLQGFDDTGKHFAIKASKSGEIISDWILGAYDLKSQAKFVLYVEKEAIFRRLLEDGVLKKYPAMIMVTGKGYPDILTRKFLRKLAEELSLKILGLGDCDPYGIDIMVVTKWGPTIPDNEFAFVPTLEWIGLRPSDLVILQLPAISHLPLSDNDRKKLLYLKYRLQDAEKSQDFVDEIEILMSLNCKAELEALYFVPNFFCCIYLPFKLEQLGFTSETN